MTCPSWSRSDSQRRALPCRSPDYNSEEKKKKTKIHFAPAECVGSLGRVIIIAVRVLEITFFGRNFFCFSSRASVGVFFLLFVLRRRSAGTCLLFKKSSSETPLFVTCPAAIIISRRGAALGRTSRLHGWGKKKRSVGRQLSRGADLLHRSTRDHVRFPVQLILAQKKERK